MGKVEFIALFTTAVSSFVLVILSWMQSNVRLARVEHTLDAAVEKQAADMKEVRAELAANTKALREELGSNMKEVREELNFNMKEVREELSSNMKEVREELSSNMKEVRDGLALIHSHLLTFYTITGKLEGRIDELSRK